MSNITEFFILKELNAADGNMVPEGALHTFVNLAIPSAITITELRGHLVNLESRHEVFSMRGEGNIKWGLTDNGKARVLRNQ